MADHVVSVVITGDITNLTESLARASQEIGSFSSNVSNYTSNMTAGVPKASSDIQNINQALTQHAEGLGRANAANATFGNLMRLVGEQTTLTGKAMVLLKGYTVETLAIWVRWMGPYQIIRLVQSGVKELIQSFVEFDQKFTESTAIMGNLSQSMKEGLVDATFKVAESTKFSASQAAEGLYFIASAGFDAKTSLAALPVVAKFAQAGMMDLEKASESLMDATFALGKVEKDAYGNIKVEETVKNMQQLSDEIIKASIDSNATVAQITEAVTGRAAGMYRELKKPTEEYIASIETMASVGVKGSEASTRLYMILRDLQKSAINNAPAFQQMGIQVYDSTGKMNNLGNIMQQLNHVMAGASDEQKKMTLQMLGFQDRSSAAILSIMDLGGSLLNYQARVTAAGGTTEEVAQKQIQSLSAQFTILKNTVTDAATKAGYAFVNFVSQVGEIATPLKDSIVSLFNGIVSNTQILIRAFQPLVAVLAGGSFKLFISLLTGLLDILQKIPGAVQILTGLFLTWGTRAVLSSTLVGTAMRNVQMSLDTTKMKLIELEQGNYVFASLSGSVSKFTGAMKSMPVAGTDMQIIAESSKKVGSALKNLGSMAAEAAPAILAVIATVVGDYMNQVAVAQQKADEVGKNMETKDYSSYLKKAAVVTAEANNMTEKYNTTMGEGTNKAVQFGRFLQKAWENATPGDNVYNDLEKTTAAMQEKAGKMVNEINNVSGAWREFGKNLGYSQDEIHAAATQLGIDMSKPIDWKGEEGKAQWKLISDSVSATRNQTLIFAKDHDIATAQVAGNMGTLEESAKKLEDEVVKAYSGITDPIKKYTEALNKAIDAQAYFKEFLDQIKSDKQAEQEAMQSAADQAAQSQIDALEAQKQKELDLLDAQKRNYSQSQQAVRQTQSNDITDQATEQKDAIVTSGKNLTDAQKKAAQDQRQQISQDSRDQKQQLTQDTQQTVDTYNDSTTAKRNAIEAQYKAQEEEIRRGSKLKQDAQKRADKEEEKTNPLGGVSELANKYNNFLDAQLKTATEYRSYLSELAGKGAPVDLLKMFQNMKPEEALPLLKDFIDNYDTQVQRFKDTNDKLKKIEGPSINEIMTQLKQSSTDMKELQQNTLELAKLGIDPAGVSEIVAKFKDQAPEMIKKLLDQAKSGDTASVRSIINQYAQFSDANIQATVAKIEHTSKFVYASYLAQTAKSEQDLNIARDELARAMDGMSPEQIMQQLKDLGYDQLMIDPILKNINGMYDHMLDESKQKWNDLIKYVQDHPILTPDQQKTETDFRQHMLDTQPSSANGNIFKFFAGGGFENHVAQISKGASRIWSEPETGGEAYIPLADSKRERSLAILRTVADMFGYSLSMQGNKTPGSSIGRDIFSSPHTTSTSSPVSNKNIINNHFNGVPVERAMIMSERRTASQLSGRTVQ